MIAPVYVWQPSTAEIAARSGIDPADVVRFDQNTSPFAPPWFGDVVLDAAAPANEYPRPDYVPLREAAAAYAGVEPKCVVPGAGADELIILCATAFLPPGGTAVTVAPTYPLYAVASAHRSAAGIELERRRQDFSLPMDRLLSAAASADLVWLCEPSNPTGNRAPDSEIRAVVEASSGVVVIDAAYGEFNSDRWGPWVDEFDNLVVLKTLSKAFGLAAIRVGYSISSPGLAARLEAVRPPGSISTVSALVAEHALRRPDWAKETVDAVARERARLASVLEGWGLQVYPSVTNFLLVQHDETASSLVEEMMWKKGLVLRAFPAPIADCFRITVRSRSDNDRLLEALKANL